MNMSTHYNAFISYKHEKKDSRIAEIVQKNLERYSIPSKIRKATGVKRINRIFRDKNELPTTSNLSDTILEALNNSDYLIVICSTKTKESIWVTREIEFFLRSHTKDKVLTVLVDGEPEEVIPPILLYDEKIVYNNMGLPTTVRENLEPLSCDFRMPLGRAKRIELPRLASALIGCTYDDLMNRHRQYVMRRVILASVAAIMLSLLFAGYMFNSRRQVQKSYEESLRNQSIYLANQSDYLMEKYQRMTALQLALEALPKDENDLRPETPEAVGALSRACYAYRAYSSTRVDSDCSYRLSDNIKDLTVSDDGRYLAAVDYSGNFAVWYLLDFSRVYGGKNKDGRTNDIEFMKDDSLIYYGDTVLHYVDVPKGEEKWSYSLGDDCFSVDSLVVNDENIYITTTEDKLLILEPKDGTLLNEFDVPMPGGAKGDEEEPSDASATDASETDALFDFDFDFDLDSFDLDSYTGDMYLDEFYVSPEKDKILFVYNAFSGKCAAACFDIKTGESVFFDGPEGRISQSAWTDNDHVVLGFIKDVFDSSLSMGNIKIQKKNHVDITCLDAGSMKSVWDSTFESTETVYESGFMYIEGNNSVTFYSGDVFSVMNASTGEKLYGGDVNDSIIYAYPSPKGCYPVFVTKGGCICNPAGEEDPDTLYMTRYFADDIDMAEIKNGSVCVHQSSSKEMISYRAGICDENWRQIKSAGDAFEIVPEEYIFDEDVFAYIGNDKKTFNLINLKDERYGCIPIPLDNGEDIRYEILGVYGDKIYINYSKDNNQILLEIDKLTGEKNETVISEGYKSTFSKLTGAGSKIFYFANDENFIDTLYSYDVATKETGEYNIQNKNGDNKDNQYFYNPPTPLINHNSVFIYNEEVSRIINTETGEICDVNLPADWAGTAYVAPIEQAGLYAVSDNNIIILFSTEGEALYTISYQGNYLAGVEYFKEKDGTELLLVFRENGTILRYMLSDGSFVGSTAISELSGQSEYGVEAVTKFDESTDTLYVRYSGYAVNAAIDTNSWVPYCTVEACFGYHKDTDRFITYGKLSDDNYAIGYFQRYTTEELKEKARTILNGAELSDELRSQYGISDD